MRKSTAHDRPTLPPPLHAGDTIGLFCPAGPIRKMEHVEAGISCLKEMGFQIALAGELEILNDKEGYLAASDTIRADHFHALWLDDNIKALMAIRGGYGCLRLLNHLDFRGIRNHPKLLIGFSDLTALLAANYTRTGLIGLHGPVVSSLTKTDSSSQERLYSVLTGSYLPFHVEDSAQVLREGTGKGRIIAGNLTTIVHLIGTPWEPAFDGSILVIEDTGEPMYKIDRLLTHLSLCGRLERLSGLILGSFDTGSTGNTVSLLRQELYQRVIELTDKHGYPVWADFPIGHLEQNQAIPYGMGATMDSRDCTLILHPDPLSEKS